MRNDSLIRIFSGESNRAFTQKICDYLKITMGNSKVMRFSEGNTYVKIDEKVRGQDVYIVQTIGLDPNNELVELLFWLDAFKRSGVNSVTAIIPFFGYAKADKKDEPRVSIRARVCADCIEVAGVDRIVTMDLHSPQIQGFFKKPVDHLYALGMFCDEIKAKMKDEYVIVSPDEGFAKNARNYANKLGVKLVIANKQRADHSETAEILGLMGDVAGKDAVIVDDFTISCGTLNETAKLLKEKGARKVIAYVTHGLITDKGIKTVENSVLDEITVTDTIYNPRIEGCEKIKILSASTLFGKAIRIIHEKDSLSDLFD
ncbi:MAG: ribose-phosphate diphosphokinase [Clostridiales bacterium]|jgi:ribose-phosphate pyrophosphokinase|nr:ribose-phosphate diphosphokinase [Clostridiales bacterium]